MISTADRNKYRGGKHATKVIVNRVPRIVAATAQINQSSFTYPIAELAIDLRVVTHAVKPGYMVMVGTTPGAWDVTVGVVKSMTDSLLRIDAKSQGDPGYARSIITPLGDNQYITVLKFRPAWGLLSSIRNGVFYKNWDVPYTGQGQNPDPVVVMGDWRQVFCPAGGSVTVALDSSVSWAWGARTIASTVWNLDGGTANTGELTDNALTADFEPGFYELECSKVDNLGNSRTGYRYLWVNVDDPDDDNAPFNYRNPCQITDDRREVKGREIALQFGKNLTDIDDLFPGQAFFITEYPTFAGELLEGDSFVKNFVGYQTEGNKVTSYKKRLTTITLKCPLAMADVIPAATQEMNEVPNPSNWTEVAKVLSNPVGAVWYVSAHHAPYLIDGHDLNYDSAALFDLRRQTFQFKSTTIGGQIKTIADMTLTKIGNKSAGQLRIVRNPIYMDLDERNALPVFWTYAPDDIAEMLQRSFYTRMQVSQVYGYAFGYDGSSNATPFQSLAPGYVRAQADGQDNITPFTVTLTATTGQTKVNAVTGHMFAENSNVPNYTFNPDRNLDFVEPIDIDGWYMLNVPGSYDVEGFGWVSERSIPVRVTCSWEYNKGAVKKTLQVEMQPESYGVPGVTIPVDRGGADNWWLNQWNPGVFDPYQPIMPDLGEDFPVMLAINSAGQFARTLSFSDPSVSWQRIKVPAGKAVSFSLDYNSGFFDNPTQEISFILMTAETDKIHVYRMLDGRFDGFSEYVNSPITATITDPKAAKIKISQTEDGFVFLAWKEADGVYFSRATGSSLSAKVKIGSTPSAVDTSPLGMDLFGTVQAVIAPTGGITLDGKDAYGLFVASGTAASFSQYTGNPDPDESALPGFVILESGHAYVSCIKAEPPAPPAEMGIVTFDPGGEIASISGAGITGDGNPDNCAYGSFNADGAGGRVGVTVVCNFPAAQYNVTDVEFDIKRLTLGGSIVGDITETVKVSCIAGGRIIASGHATFRENYFNSWARWGISSAEMPLSEPPDTIRVSYGYSFPDSNPFTIVYAFIDNVHITGTPIDFEGTRKLYSVNISSEDWDDITPSGKQLPSNPYALYPSAGTSAIGTAETGKVYFMNQIGGDSWATNRTPYAGLLRSGEFVLAWGYNAIGISPDTGATFYPRIGDWASKIGSPGEFICVGGVL